MPLVVMVCACGEFILGNTEEETKALLTEHRKICEKAQK